jgi:hypothetical protein
VRISPTNDLGGCWPDNALLNYATVVTGGWTGSPTPSQQAD